jgi:hypothetical protein
MNGRLLPTNRVSGYNDPSEHFHTKPRKDGPAMNFKLPEPLLLVSFLALVSAVPGSLQAADKQRPANFLVDYRR